MITYHVYAIVTIHHGYDVQSYDSPPKFQGTIELTPSLSDHWKLVPFLTLSAACVMSWVMQELYVNVRLLVDLRCVHLPRHLRRAT